MARGGYVLREIELSAVTLGQVTDNPAGSVHISLPASKCDAVGDGAARSHVCVCDLAPAAASICPACTVRMQVSARKGELGEHAHWQGEPLFPDINGARCTKASIQATIVAAAATVGLETKGPTGALLFTGHALRATGAMCLAAAGLDANSVGLLGRWGSDVVRICMREAPLRALQTVARTVVAPAVPAISAQLSAPAWAPALARHAGSRVRPRRALRSQFGIARRLARRSCRPSHCPRLLRTTL